MTTSDAFRSFAGVVADLARKLPQEQRFHRLLDAFRRNFPCDAIALLRREGSLLVPCAVAGLGPETMGRRFALNEHPRLAQIVHSGEPVRFRADSALPDPYDGLVDTDQERLFVHDCMGASLYVDNQPWGAVTLDAINPGAFEVIDRGAFSAFVSLAAATVRASDWIQRLEEKLQRHVLLEQSRQQEPGVDELLGESASMHQLRREAEVVARSDLPVLIQGETGVGKELVARYLHRLSERAHEPMVHINCAALPESIAESELFGHVRGAFSGATTERPGKFQLADGATLLLDEVGELPLTLQPKLLRALQNGEIQRVGSDRHHRVDVRVIAATNRNLKEEVMAGRFRADLYHRLSVYPLVVPPLREREQDAVLLAGAFLQRCERRLGLRGVRLAKSARDWLSGYSWPGNVRELEHAISRAVVKALSSGQTRERIIELQAQHLGAERLAPTPAVPAALEAQVASSLPLQDALEQYRREIITTRLREHDGNLSATARSLGLDRGNFHRLLTRLGLR
jgi:anaerobic nitric oxide reductase transcription regulator